MLAFVGYYAAPAQAAHVAQNSCEDPFNGEQPKFGLGYWEKTDFCQHNVEYDEILSGGPPPDGIPAIDAPKFDSVAEADGWLAGVEPVISLIVNGESKAYPLQIMTWHEIVNDEVSGHLLPAV